MACSKCGETKGIASLHEVGRVANAPNSCVAATRNGAKGTPLGGKMRKKRKKDRQNTTLRCVLVVDLTGLAHEFGALATRPKRGFSCKLANCLDNRIFGAIRVFF